VLRVMLPIPLSLAADVAVEVVVLVVIIIVVDLNVATVPIATAPVATPSAPRSGTQRDSRAPRQSCPGDIPRIGIGIVRVLNRSRPVHHSRVVRGHINNVGVRLLDRDNLLATGNCLGLHYRLGAGFQTPCALSLRTHALDCIHHVRLLRQECVPQVGGPLDIARHPLNHVRELYQSLNAWIPRLL
jgi:hypothetical protein